MVGLGEWIIDETQMYSYLSFADGSQENVVNLAGLIVNLTILPLLAEDQTLTWTLFFILTLLHLFANYKAVRSLRFATLNKERLLWILQAYFNNGQILSIEEANDLESVIVGIGLNEKDILGRRINFGCSFDKVLETFPNNLSILKTIIQALKDEKYFIFSNKFSSEVNVILSHSALQGDVFHAYLKACLIAKLGDSQVENSYSDQIMGGLTQHGFVTDFLQASTLGWTGGCTSN